MDKKTVAQKGTAPKIDWTKREAVIKLLETNGRVLTAGEKDLIDGQRQINGHFFEAITAIFEHLTLSKGASTKKTAATLATLKESFKNVPGDGPPGCVPPKSGPGSGGGGQE